MFNPFFIAGYGGPEYFCDREQETQRLINALTNRRNVVFISPRRLGKTALIQHTFNRIIKEDPNARCFYFDIFNTQNQAEFVTLFGEKVLGELDNLSEKVISGLSTLLKSCRPLFSINQITNTPEVSITIEPEKCHKSLEEIFNYMNSSGHECYIAIDEFQQITTYPEAGTEALIRSLMQFAEHVHFVFAGSKQHIMAKMFASPNRPFYQSCQKMGLKPIPVDKYYDFAARMFKRQNRKLPNVIFERVYSLSKGYTWFVQDMMNRLYSNESTTIQMSDLDKIIEDVIDEGEVTFKNFCSLFSAGQLRLVKAIAIEDTVEKPYEQVFMQKHKLTATSSVKQALKTLSELSIIEESESGYFVSDRYFSMWLRQSLNRNHSISR